MISRPRLVVVGSLNMDLVVRVPSLPQPGETVIGGTFLRAAGGKGANQAVAAARLGAAVAMVGRVGDDAFGDELGRRLAEEGIEAQAVHASGATTGVALIVVDAAGQNSIAVASGANALLAPSDVPADLLVGSDVVLAQLECPIETVEHAFRTARAAGAATLLNAAPAGAIPSTLLEAADVLVINEHELAALLGRETVPAGGEAAAARELRAWPGQVVVVTLGDRGAVAAAGDALVEQSALPVDVVDTTAAGDAFVAAFARAYWPERDPTAALRFACAAGALACTRPGAQPSLPTLDAVMTLLSRGGS
jgi:ribokinase